MRLYTLSSTTSLRAVGTAMSYTSPGIQIFQYSAALLPPQCCGHGCPLAPRHTTFPDNLRDCPWCLDDFALHKQMALVSNVEFYNDHPPLFLWDVCNFRQCYHLIKSGWNQSCLHNVWEDVVIVTSSTKPLLIYCCTPVSIAGPLGTFQLL